MARSLVALLIAVALAAAPRAAGTLDIYWIDVEGGASTLIVTPEGQSVLMDTGYAGMGERDPARIEHVVRTEAGLTRLDYLLTSHFHGDHAGGIAAVAQRLPVGTFVDYGDSIDRNTAAGREVWSAYLAAAGPRRRTVTPGERLDLAGADLTFLTADGRTLQAPLSPVTPNPSCAAFTSQPEDTTENAHSLGYRLRVGAFDFLDLGDVSWNFQHRLVCPGNLIGTVDLMQAPHHGTRDDVLPQLLAAVTPSVIVMNNGPTKGAGAVAVEAVRRSPGLLDWWSLHRATANDDSHNAAEALTANLGGSDGCPAHWLRARVNGDGTYTLTNSRNRYAKTYRVR